MEQRDLIKDEIERLGKVLGKILADFLGLKSKGKISEAINISNDRFQSELDIDIEKIISLSSGELKRYINDRNLTDTHLEVISEYLLEVGISQTDKADKVSHLKKAIELLDIADEISRTFSFERMNRKSTIKKHYH